MPHPSQLLHLPFGQASALAFDEGTTVRGVAIACGMPRMATLISEYVARFGERPSDTLRRRGR